MEKKATRWKAIGKRKKSWKWESGSGISVLTTIKMRRTRKSKNRSHTLRRELGEGVMLRGSKTCCYRKKKEIGKGRNAGS